MYSIKFHNELILLILYAQPNTIEKTRNPWSHPQIQ